MNRYAKAEPASCLACSAGDGLNGSRGGSAAAVRDQQGVVVQKEQQAAVVGTAVVAPSPYQLSLSPLRKAEEGEEKTRGVKENIVAAAKITAETTRVAETTSAAAKWKGDSNYGKFDTSNKGKDASTHRRWPGAREDAGSLGGGTQQEKEKECEHSGTPNYASSNSSSVRIMRSRDNEIRMFLLERGVSQHEVRKMLPLMRRDPELMSDVGVLAGRIQVRAARREYFLE